MALGYDPAQCFYDSEDGDVLKRLLDQQYQVVVGNPPYIVVDDDGLRAVYRARYGSCSRQYQLCVPFTERFFDLASPDPESGYIGLILSNAFMTRSFGRPLIEEYFPRWDLTHVVDTSGVHVPDHGTPTAVLFGRSRPPTTDLIRAVRGIRGESKRPENPAQAPVWLAVSTQIDEPGSTSHWVSVSDSPRKVFHHHPWCIGGGGAAELKHILDDRCGSRLGAEVEDIGRVAVMGEDNAWFVGDSQAHRTVVAPILRQLVQGEDLRDWTISPGQVIPYPYETIGGVALGMLPLGVLHRLWPVRQLLRERTVFGKTLTDMGKGWFELLEHYTSKLKNPLCIAFAFVGTHNQFAFDRGGKVFNRSVPVIKLRSAATESDHLGLTGILNSSAACFWFKQVCYNKGTGGISEGLKTEHWEQFHEISASALSSFPLPADRPIVLTQAIQLHVDGRRALLSDHFNCGLAPSVGILDAARHHAATHLARMIALQEELDWQVYHLYDLLGEDLSLPPEEVPPLKLGERPFEIVMARQMAAGELETTWFERHGSTPITELPAHWPERYRRAVERRLEFIANSPDIALIEQPEYKRRWNLPKWEDLERKALENWLLDRMESAALWADPELKSCSRLADLLRRDAEFAQVAEMLEGRPDYDIAALVKHLALKQAVPFLPVLRYKPSGLEKRREWEKTWELQRREDASDKVEIPVPPKYRSADFQDATWWSLRGSLDVPKERFILYSGLEGTSDSSPAIGWAGWNHLQQAQALTAYYQHVKAEEGWPIERLKPALAGLLELIPWLKQWHNEPDPATGERMGNSFSAFLEAECQELGITVDSLQEWTPARTARAGRRRG